MARVLIAPIGTGIMVGDRKYKTAKYKFDKSDRIYETSFVASAIAEELKVDRIVFVGTTKSMWEEIYRYFTEVVGDKLNDDYWIEIAQLTDEANSKNILIDENILEKTMNAVDNYLKAINPKATGGSSHLLIKYGLDELELWENFDLFMKFTQTLENNDEIYLDITHSFRSIPLFMYLMMDFIQTLGHKNISLKGLYYGMLEVQKEKQYAPIIDLNPLFQISKWIRATHDFVNYGNGYMISKLTDDESLSKNIDNISELVNINYLTDLQKEINNFNYIFNKGYERLGAMKYIIPLMEDFIKQFKGAKSASKFQLKVSEWYFNNHRYGHGYICLVESVLTKLCEVYKLDISNIKDRDKAKGLLARNKYSKYEDLKKLSNKYFEINNIRNRIAHGAFYSQGKYSYEEDIKNTKDHLKIIEILLNSPEINKLNELISLEL